MERDEIVRIARERLGVTSRFSTGEYTMLASLLEPGEEIEAMLLAKPAEAWLLASGVLVVATGRRVLIVSKAMVSRRERVEEIPREQVRGTRLMSPLHIVLELQDGERGFSMAQPGSQLAALAAWAHGRRSRYDELDEVVRRKLGRLVGAGQELSLPVLDRELGEDEAVLDVAWSAKSPEALIVVCPERLVLVPEQPMRSLRPPEQIAYTDVLWADSDGDDLVLGMPGGLRRFEQLVPGEAAEIIAGRVAARLSGDGRAGG